MTREYNPTDRHWPSESGQWKEKTVFDNFHSSTIWMIEVDSFKDFINNNNSKKVVGLLPLAWFVKPPKIADKAKLVERVHPIATVHFEILVSNKSHS